jgi:hypothetical protein
MLWIPGRPRHRSIFRASFFADGLEPRLLLATVSGTVWNDVNGDGVRFGVIERGLPGWTVYLDGNDNGAMDAAELRDVTDSAGAYSIASDALRVGTLHLRQVQPAGWRPTNPVDGEETVIIGRLGDVITGVDFGNTQLAAVRGSAFNDINEDGGFDRGEAALSGWTIFADIDNDGVLDAGEASDVTDASGEYALNLAAGTYTIRQVTQAGWWQTAPVGGSHLVTVAAGQVVSGRNFGDIVATYDLFGVGFAITSAFDPPPADGRLDVFFQIRNDGTADSPGFRVAFYLSNDATITASDTLLRSIANGSVPRHSTADRTTVVTLPRPDPFRTDNRYLVGMIVDVDGDVTETDESNNANRGLLADQYPVKSEADLPSPVDGSAVLARPIALGSSITSAIGDEWIGAYDQDVYRFDAVEGYSLLLNVSDPPSTIESQFFKYRLYDGSWNSLARFSPWRVPETGTYYAVVSAFENDSDNPRRLSGRTSGATGAYGFRITNLTPDLAPAGISVSGNLPVVTVSVTLSSGVVDVDLRFSEDELITPADMLLGTVRTELTQQGTIHGQMVVALPALDPFRTDNEYWIGMVIDPANAIVETDEQNNIGGEEGVGRARIIAEQDAGSPADGSRLGVSRSPLSVFLPRSGELGDEWIGPYDMDVFKVEANASERLSFDVDRVSGEMDSYVRLFNDAWVQQAENDNGAAPGEPRGTDSFLEHTFTHAGTYYLVVSGRGNHTGHPLRMTGRSPVAGGRYTVSLASEPAGPVTGTVFDDANSNGVRDAGEMGLAGWTIYLGEPDTDLGPAVGAPSAVTDASGVFLISDARAGTYGLGLVPQAGWFRTTPALQASHVVALASGQPAGPFLFGFARAATITGSTFDDVNSSGARDPGETGLAAWTVFLDTNNNGVRDSRTVTYTAADLANTEFAASRIRAPDDPWAEISDVNVTVDAQIITSVDLRLTQERGPTVSLANDAYGRSHFQFDDEGADRPFQPLSAFDGAAPGGVWVLSASFAVAPPAFPIGGELRAWSLTLTLTEPFIVTDADGNYTFAGLLPGAPDRQVRVVPGNPDDWIPTGPAGGVHAVSLGPGETASGIDFASHLRRLRVEGRQLFYNNSSFDGRDPAADAADDGAIATDKRASMPRQGSATFANYSSYTRGINGLMIDVDELRGPLSLTDFAFKVASPLDPSQWIAAPAPNGFAVRPLDVPGSPDRRRVTFTWPDGAIRNAWLQITVLADATTRRIAPDVFYFGNLVGETGDRAAVSSRDFVAARAKLFSRSEPITSRFDFDRDGRVTALDLIAVRRNLGRALPGPTVPAVVVAAQPLRLDDSEGASGLLKQEEPGA